MLPGAVSAFSSLAMSVKLKAVLLIALLAGHEASRVIKDVRTARNIKNHNGFSQKSQQEDATGMEGYFDVGCDADVIVQAELSNTQKIDVRVPKDDLKSSNGVEVGRQPKNECDTVYSLLCESDLTTLRQQASCGEHHPQDSHFGRFNPFKHWRSTQPGVGPFKFTDAFNTKYAGSKLKDADVVHFTTTTRTCADAGAAMAKSEKTLKESLDDLKNIEESASFDLANIEESSNFLDKAYLKERTAKLKPFQKAKMRYDNMGCSQVPGDKSTSILDGMVDRLRENYVKAMVAVDVVEEEIGRASCRERV